MDQRGSAKYTRNTKAENIININMLIIFNLFLKFKSSVC